VNGSLASRTRPALVSCIPVADHALLVNLGEVIDDDTNALVVALDQCLTNAPPLGYRESVPAFVNLLVEFDPGLTDHEQMRKAVEGLLHDMSAAKVEGRLHEVEICYEGDFGLDLAHVALSTGLSVEEVINCHLQGSYKVRMYGFAPGYAYMSGVPRAIQMPRKASALRDIAAGSVICAGPQCLVTTLTMPTGWSIIGRSPTRIFTGDETTPFLFEVGDRVRFKRISLSEFASSEALNREAQNG
jgi:inhibitor of KinA